MAPFKTFSAIANQGQTKLFGNIIVSKDDPRVEAYGALDELNSLLGFFSGHKFLRQFQSDLMLISSYLADPDSKPNLASLKGKIAKTEKEIDRINAKLTPLQNFILPGGTKTAALYQYARAVCRRAERRLVTLSKKTSVTPEILLLVDRLSDLLFLYSRLENKRHRKKEVLWIQASPGEAKRNGVRKA